MNRRGITGSVAAATAWLFFAATLFCRLASCISPVHGGFWALAALLLPVVLVLDAAVLLGLLLGRRWRLALLPLAAVASCGSYLASVVRPPARHPAAAAPHDLRVMTLNAYGFLRLGDHFTTIPAIVRIVERERPDVLCLQEAFDSPYFPGDSITARFSDCFPYFVRGDISAIGSRYPIVDHRYVAFPGTLNDYMWADLAIGADTVRLFTMHLQTTGFSELRGPFRPGYLPPISPRKLLAALARNSRLRARQVEEIRQVIDTTRYPVIVTGDFNDPPGTYTYRRLKGTLTDSFRAAGHGIGSTYRRLGDWLRIDYIFSSPTTFEAVDLRTLPDDVSDHSALIADLRFDR